MAFRDNRDVTVVLAGLLLVLGQSATAQPSREGPVSLERIREGLRQSSILTDTSEERVKFRLTIEQQRLFELPLLWDPLELEPDFVRTPYPLYHQEFLLRSAGEEFRAGALTGGPDLWGPISDGIKSLKHAAQRRRQAEIRKQIKEELRLLLEAQRKDPDK